MALFTRLLIGGLVAGFLVVMTGCEQGPADVVQAPLDQAQLGKGNNKGGGNNATQAQILLGGQIFEDQNLSLNRNQSCMSCHHPSQGFAAPVVGSPFEVRGSVVEGSVDGRFGDRKPPTAAYATLSPVLSPSGRTPTGGNFWDGRATGALLGNPAADQAQMPFLNPKEQALPHMACVVYRVVEGAYASPTYEDVYGTVNVQWPSGFDASCGSEGTSFSFTPGELAEIQEAYDNIALAIAAFESSLNQFASPFDRGTLSALAREGESLFSSKGKCHQCHTAKGSQPAFSDFRYHNLGVPRNPNNPTLTGSDPGLFNFTGNFADYGKFKTPTVRNVGRGEFEQRFYMHNGVLTSLKQVVDFYNTRDVLRTCTAAEIASLDPSEYGSFGAGCWPPPEYSATMDSKNMGNLGLTEAEVNAIVQFMRELSDPLP